MVWVKMISDNLISSLRGESYSGENGLYKV